MSFSAAQGRQTHRKEYSFEEVTLRFICYPSFCFLYIVWPRLTERITFFNEVLKLRFDWSMLERAVVPFQSNGQRPGNWETCQQQPVAIH